MAVITKYTARSKLREHLPAGSRVGVLGSACVRVPGGWKLNAVLPGQVSKTYRVFGRETRTGSIDGMRIEEVR